MEWQVTGGNCRSRRGAGGASRRGAGARFQALVVGSPWTADVLLVVGTKDDGA